MLAAGYGIPRQHGRDLGGSLNLLVRRGGDRLVARVYRPSVSGSRLEEIQQVRRRLEDAGVPCSALVPARNEPRGERLRVIYQGLTRAVPRVRR